MLAKENLIFRNGKWTDGEAEFRNVTSFWAVRGYYPNQIGYARATMCFVAAFFTVRAPWLAAALLFGSTLLDWIDGPIARRTNQCSIYGSGVDWFADVCAQIIAMGWLVSLQPALLPWIGAALAIELGNCIFDFATTATAHYPKLPPHAGAQNKFFAILDWCTPEGSYSTFGTALWLAYPLCILAFCLQWKTAGLALLVPAVLYLWCELAWMAFILINWAEPPRQEAVYDDGPEGFRHCGMASEAARELMLDVSRSAFACLSAECAASKAEGKIFWINICQGSGGSQKMPLNRVEELDTWARSVVDRHYAGEDIVLDGYGLIVNPIGSLTQEWHLDYTRDYSTVLIPMSELTPENAVQYLVIPSPVDVENPDRVDLNRIARSAAWVSVRQLLAPEWSLLRMGFGAIHRGIGNTGSFDRTMFWISVKKRGVVSPSEPELQTFVHIPG